MVRPFATLRATVAAGAAALAACTSGCGAGPSQRGLARFFRPAEIRATPARPSGEIRVRRIRAHADEDYRAQDPGWAETIAAQVRRASAVLEPEFGVRLEVDAVRPWTRTDRSADIDEALDQLMDLDQARDVDWIVGFVGPGAPAERKDEARGIAQPFGRHFVLRAMESPADRAALARWDDLTPDERTAWGREQRQHRETGVFLHEWGHTLGAVHECADKWIMTPGHTLLRSMFSPQSARLVRTGLAHRDRGDPDAMRDWAAAYRADAGSMLGAALDCSSLEKGLEEAEAALARIVRTGVREPNAPTRWSRRAVRALHAALWTSRGGTRVAADRDLSASILVAGDGAARLQVAPGGEGTPLHDLLERALQRVRFPPPPAELRDRLSTSGFRVILEKGGGERIELLTGDSGCTPPEEDRRGPDAGSVRPQRGPPRRQGSERMTDLNSSSVNRRCVSVRTLPSEAMASTIRATASSSGASSTNRVSCLLPTMA